MKCTKVNGFDVFGLMKHIVTFKIVHHNVYSVVCSSTNSTECQSGRRQSHRIWPNRCNRIGGRQFGMLDTNWDLRLDAWRQHVSSAVVVVEVALSLVQLLDANCFVYCWMVAVAWHTDCMVKCASVDQNHLNKPHNKQKKNHNRIHGFCYGIFTDLVEPMAYAVHLQSPQNMMVADHDSFWCPIIFLFPIKCSDCACSPSIWQSLFTSLINSFLDDVSSHLSRIDVDVCTKYI